MRSLFLLAAIPFYFLPPRRGEAGAIGKNLRITATGDRIELPGATSYPAGTEEELIIETPGGGGWGHPKL